MKATYKLNQPVCIATMDGEHLNILLGTVAGAYKNVTDTELHYLVDTCMGRYDRTSDGIWLTPQDIADHIMDYVVQ